MKNISEYFGCLVFDDRVMKANLDEVKKGQRVSFKVPEKIRPSDKLYKLVAPEDLKKK